MGGKSLPVLCRGANIHTLSIAFMSFQPHTKPVWEKPLKLCFFHFLKKKQIDTQIHRQFFLGGGLIVCPVSMELSHPLIYTVQYDFCSNVLFFLFLPPRIFLLAMLAAQLLWMQEEGSCHSRESNHAVLPSVARMGRLMITLSVHQCVGVLQCSSVTVCIVSLRSC